MKVSLTMILDRTPLGVVLAACLSLAASYPALGCALPARAIEAPRPDQEQPQEEPRPRIITPAAADGASLAKIDEDYNRQLLMLEKQRIERLRQLAATQSAKDAEATYELLFRVAINNNLFNETEPVAQQVVKTGTASPVVVFLAHTIDIIASADRGNFDESLAELRSVIDSQSERNRPAQGAPSTIDTRALLTICEAYYQRLLQGDRFDIAKNAFELVLKQSENATVKGYCAARLNQLAMIGKPAPAILGTDLDGKPFDLAALKGNVVLIDFWASWCMPSSAEVTWFDQVYTKYSPSGFRIVGINVDTLQKDAPKLETVMPNIRKFLIEHNVRWPNLINGTGAQDYTTAFGVSEIPTNILIGRDGNVLHLDLSRKNLDKVIARATAQ
jgi:thiol-disulfide isomerase/thioredoxin